MSSCLRFISFSSYNLIGPADHKRQPVRGARIPRTAKLVKLFAARTWRATGSVFAVKYWHEFNKHCAGQESDCQGQNN
jgi:hypothetical protein